MIDRGRNRDVRRACLAVIVSAGVLTGAGCAPGEPGEPDVELPARWREIGPTRSEVGLWPGGSGYVDDILSPQVGDCDLMAAERYSGEITWHARDEGSYVLQYDGGEVILWADTAYMGALNWDKVVLGICGEETPREALVSFGGGPLRDQAVNSSFDHVTG